jgi:cyclopropane fatty-acyl-phospholipid synthase-like methyltransferase
MILDMGVKMKRIINKISSIYWEYYFGVSTRGVCHSSADKFGATWYSTQSYRSIYKILDRVKMSPEDVFVDVGCGLGRVLCCASRYKLKNVIGIEYDRDLANNALANVQKVMKNKRCGPIEVINKSAQEYDYENVSIAYLFNPFGHETMKLFLDKLTSAWCNRKKCQLIYVLPACDDLIQQTGMFRRTQLIHANTVHSIENDVSIWEASG